MPENNGKQNLEEPLRTNTQSILFAAMTTN